MPKENETTGLNDGRKWWLVSNAMDVGISDNECPGLFVGTIGPLGLSER